MSKVKWALLGAILPASARAEPPATPLPPGQRMPTYSERKPVSVVEGPEAPDRRPAPVMRERGGCGTPGGFRVYGGTRLAVARVFNQKSADGYGGRAEIEMIYTSRKLAGGLFGATMGLEGWGSTDGGGGGVPFSFYFGASSPRFFFSVGAGWQWLTVDRVKSDTGLGLFSPLATATAGFWVDRIRFMVDARALYRWHVGSDHFGQTALGFSLGLPL